MSVTQSELERVYGLLPQHNRPGLTGTELADLNGGDVVGLWQAMVPLEQDKRISCYVGEDCFLRWRRVKIAKPEALTGGER